MKIQTIKDENEGRVFMPLDRVPQNSFFRVGDTIWKKFKMAGVTFAIDSNYQARQILKLQLHTSVEIVDDFNSRPARHRIIPLSEVTMEEIFKINDASVSLVPDAGERWFSRVMTKGTAFVPGLRRCICLQDHQIFEFNEDMIVKLAVAAQLQITE